ncbi:hypothetical protein D5047_04700 [Verminephrobacter eiseniae]|nr:hypothetical protein [Verminephrobacter eiseniae]
MKMIKWVLILSYFLLSSYLYYSVLGIMVSSDIEGVIKLQKQEWFVFLELYGLFAVFVLLLIFSMRLFLCKWRDVTLVVAIYFVYFGFTVLVNFLVNV